MDELEIAIADPRLDDVRQLVEHHLKFGRSHNPPQDAHALEVDSLLDPAVTLFSIRRRGELAAIGALKRLDDKWCSGRFGGESSSWQFDCDA